MVIASLSMNPTSLHIALILHMLFTYIYVRSFIEKRHAVWNVLDPECNII